MSEKNETKEIIKTIKIRKTKYIIKEINRKKEIKEIKEKEECIEDCILLYLIKQLNKI